MKEIKSVDSSYINSLLHGGPGSGRFKKGTSGYDADGDGIVNDHQNQPRIRSKKSDSSTKPKESESSNKETKPNFNNQRIDYGRAISESGKTITDTGNFIKNMPVGKKGQKIYADVSDLNDADLRRKINRIKNEREFSDLTGQTKYIKSGKEKIAEILSVAGPVVSITGGIVSIITSIIRAKSASHSCDLDDSYCLAHYGVKGMRWGVVNEKDLPSFKKPKYTDYEKYLNNKKAKDRISDIEKEYKEKDKIRKNLEYRDARALAEGRLMAKKMLSVFGSLALGPLSIPIMGNNAWNPFKDMFMVRHPIYSRIVKEKQIKREMGLKK